MIALRLALLATAAFAAPAAEADADPQFLLGHGLAYGHIAYAAPLCKVVPKTVTVGQRCHAEPDCVTEKVVVGRHITGVDDPTCTDVEHVVPAVAPYVAHATTKVTTKHCVPGAPIVEDVTADVTKCTPKSVCEDVTAEVLETVCGDAAADAEAVEEA